ncbi:MAG: VanW family protein [Clostridiales bacterium]|nr:VanW family protein [Clostridiales bacterium]
MNDGNNQGERHRRAQRTMDPILDEPSMSAPSPMPGKPAGAHARQTGRRASQMQPKQQEARVSAQQGWSTPQQTAAPQQPYGYPVQPVYPPRPSQGIPGGQLPPQQYGAWQQGYSPAPQQAWQQPYQQHAGRGWSQPYPVQNQQPQPQNQWQGGYSVNPWEDGYPPMQDSSQQPSGSIPGMPPVHPRPSRNTILKLVAAAIVLVIAVCVVVGTINHRSEKQALYASVAAYDDRYCQGVYVDGIHLGGMTREEAQAVVQKNAQLKCDEWNVSLVTSENEYVGEINSYHLGMTVHVEDVLDEAWKQGHTGSTAEERYAAMNALLETPYYAITAMPSGSTEAVDSILNAIAESVYVPATNASAIFEPWKVNPFTITPETVGRYLDVASIKNQVYDMLSRMESGVVIVAPTPLYPSITQADVERQTSLIGTHYTAISTTSTENRVMNIKRACELINGTVIAPGKNFSFNDVVGPRTAKTGFYKAIEYAYGKQVEGYGGGICQVSSTIYVAAVRANLDILKRTQHALEVNYTPFGLDATVNYDGKKIDFVFQNNTGGNLYIVTKVMKKPKVDNNHSLVVCEIYGPALEAGVTYDLIATKTEVPIPEPTTVPDKKAEYVVYTDETYTVNGSVGYEVDSYKVKYVDGKEVDRTFMYHDTYAAVQPIIYVGVSERPLETTEPW